MNYFASDRGPAPAPIEEMPKVGELARVGRGRLGRVEKIWLRRGEWACVLSYRTEPWAPKEKITVRAASLTLEAV